MQCGTPLSSAWTFKMKYSKLSTQRSALLAALIHNLHTHCISTGMITAISTAQLEQRQETGASKVLHVGACKNPNETKRKTK